MNSFKRLFKSFLNYNGPFKKKIIFSFLVLIEEETFYFPFLLGVHFLKYKSLLLHHIVIITFLVEVTHIAYVSILSYIPTRSYSFKIEFFFFFLIW